MSSAANKAVVQQIFADSAIRSGTTFLDSMADDVCWTVTGQGSWARTFEGRDAVLNGLMKHVGSLFPTRLRTHATTIVAEGDFVVVEAKGDGNFTHDGQRYDNDYCMVFRFEGGRIRHIKEYLDTALVERVLGPWPTA